MKGHHMVENDVGVPMVFGEITTKPKTKVEEHRILTRHAKHAAELRALYENMRLRER
jgi:hypothetical protein